MGTRIHNQLLVPFCQVALVSGVGWEVLEQRGREGLVGGVVGCCLQSEECPAWQEAGKTLCSSGVSGRQSQGGLGEEALVWTQEMLCVCVRPACMSPCGCSMGRAVVLDLGGKERVNTGVHVGSSPDTSADPLCDLSRSSASQALPFLIYKVETATSISAGL